MTDPQASAAPPASEPDSVLAVLERNRRTFAWKTAGLDEQGLREAVDGRVGEAAPEDFSS